MADNQQYVTKKDLEEFGAQLRAGTKQDLLDLENKLLEAMRDMQTEMLRGLERFAVGNFARMHRLEVSDNDLNERVNVLEQRVLTLELRQPPPIAPPPRS
jgi:hypothetical protein